MGNILLKWFIVWEVEAEIIVESNELIFGESAIGDVQ